MVLDRIDALPQDVVLEVQQLEAGVQVLDEVADLDSELVVTKGNRVDCQPGKLVREGCNRQQVLLDGDVECVAVREVHRY